MRRFGRVVRVSFQVNVTTIIQYQAQCLECTWTGEIHFQEHEAEAEADAHRKVHIDEWEAQNEEWDRS